jgi:hypothetical protein
MRSSAENIASSNADTPYIKQSCFLSDIVFSVYGTLLFINILIYVNKTRVFLSPL